MFGFRLHCWQPPSQKNIVSNQSESCHGYFGCFFPPHPPENLKAVHGALKSFLEFDLLDHSMDVGILHYPMLSHSPNSASFPFILDFVGYFDHFALRLVLMNSSVVTAGCLSRDFPRFLPFSLFTSLSCLLNASKMFQGSSWQAVDSIYAGRVA